MLPLQKRSPDGGRRKRDLFVVYADDDEAWVTGTLLDIIFTRHPCYDVILQQHLQHSCDSRATQLKWNHYEQMIFASVIEQSTMTVVVLSGNFLRTVWSSINFRSMLVNKVDSQRHRFLFIFLDDDVISDAADPDIPDDRKQLYDCAATQGRLAACEPLFAERLCDYLLPPSGPQVDQYSTECCDSDESVALINSCQPHQRY